jgi:transcriptional regulator with XRE-family HTH domain
MGRRSELGTFLRVKRDIARPGRRIGVGNARRRVLGLRREEIAERAGISVDWYARLEQGREIQASAKTIDAIGDVLALSPVERAYTHILAQPSAGTRREAGLVPGSVKQLLREMPSTPAYVMDSTWRMIDWNATAVALFGDPKHFTGHQRNCLWQHFLGKPFSRLLANAADVLPYVTALFRFTTAFEADAAWRRSLVAELCDASKEFASFWSQHNVADWGEGRKLFDHPDIGRLTFTNISHQLSGMSGPTYRIVTYLPDPETREKLLTWMPAKRKSRRNADRKE